MTDKEKILRLLRDYGGMQGAEIIAILPEVKQTLYDMIAREELVMKDGYKLIPTLFGISWDITKAL